MQKPDNSVVLYQDENGITNVRVLFADEDLWLTQSQIAEIYDTTQPNISMHINGILKDGELSPEATHKKFLLVQTEGTRQVKREVSHYNLDMIIAIGYRVQSQIATRFRRWATQRLHEYTSIEKAEKEFAIYRAREMKQLESDFDRAIKALAKSKKALRKRGGGTAETELNEA